MIRFRFLLPFMLCLRHSQAADPPDSAPPPINWVTKWLVTYSDSSLGELKGIAYVNWDDHSARVVIRDPQGGSEKSLVATDVHVSEDDQYVTMTLRGAGFSGDHVTAPQNAGAKQLPAAELTKVAIEGGFGQKEIAVEAKAPADSSLVRLSLHRGAFGVLQGQWSYYADPITQRDALGGGRVGWFRLLNEAELDQLQKITGRFLGEQSGREQWWPIPAEFAAVEVVENQLISDQRGPIYPAPTHEESPYAVFDSKITKWGSEISKHRTLFIAGRNFASPDESHHLRVQGAEVSGPRLIGRWSDPKLSDELKKKFEIGWAKMASDSPTDKPPINSGMDAELWEITLDDLALPGPKKCRYYGETKEWLLQYGNNRAEARFLRPLKQLQAGDETSVNELEASQTFYIPERVALEVQTRIDLPFDHLQVRVGTNRSADALKVVAANRVSPGLYRTVFFKIGAADLPAKEGDELLATVDQRDLLDNHNFQFVGAVLGKARLALTPASREQGKSGGLWKDALLRAAKFAGKENLPLAQLTNTTAEEIHDIKVTVGDHAAMLLLREAFVDKMKAQLDWLDGLKSDEDLKKFRDWVEPYLSGDNRAFYAQPQGPNSADSSDAALKYPSWLSFLPAKDKKELFKTLEDLNEGVETVLNLPADVAKAAGIAASVFVMAIDNIAGGNLKQYGVRWGRGSTLARIVVTGPDGSPAPFYEAFDRYDNPTANSFKTEADKLRWQLDATKEAVKKYRDVVEESKNYAEKIDPSDREELLKLTGIGFGAVIYDLIPRLMRLDEVGSPPALLWVPDTTAREAVCNLGITHKAIRAQKEVRNVKYHMGVRAAMVVLAAPAVIGEGAAATIVGLAGNTLMWGAQSLQAITETYKSRQDVQFELGYAIVLGPERLAEAEARKQDWLSTIASVVATGALIVLDAWPQAQKELAVFRGRKICDAKQMRGDLNWFRGLTKDQAADVFAYVERGDLRNYTARPMSRGDATKLYKAECAGHEARAPPPKKPSVVEKPTGKPGEPLEGPKSRPGFREGQTEAITEAPPGKGQAEPGFRDAETQGVTKQPEGEGQPGGGVREAQTEIAAEEAAKNPALEETLIEEPPPEGLPKPLVAGIHYGEEIPIVRDLPRTGAPAENSWWYAGTSKNGDPVHYKLGKRLGKGASSEVYVIEDVSGRPRFDKLVVIKFVRDDLKKSIPGRVVRGKKIDTVWTKGVFGTAKEQIKRMLFSEEQLTKANIKHAKIIEAHPELETPIVIQEKVPIDGKSCLQVNAKDLMTRENLLGKEVWVPKPYAEVCKLFPPEMQDAVPRFYRELADAGLASTDMSLANVYFEKSGGKWTCGVLDVDHVVPYGQETGHMTSWWVSKNEETLQLLLDKGKEISNVVDFMEAMGTQKMGGNYQHPFMFYDGVTKEIRPILIDPAIWEKYFPDLKKGIPKPRTPTKKAADSTIPVWMRGRQQIMNWPQCEPVPEFALAA